MGEHRGQEQVVKLRMMENNGRKACREVSQVPICKETLGLNEKTAPIKPGQSSPTFLIHVK